MSGEKKDSNYHSSAYHRFFEDWAEKLTFDESGKSHVERVYVGFYYTIPLDMGKRIFRKMIYIVLYAGALSLYVVSGIQTLPVNTAFFPSLIVAICLFAMAFLAFTVVRILISPKEMLIRQYRATNQALLNRSRIAALCLFISALVNTFYALLLEVDIYRFQTFICALRYFCAGLLIFILHFLEKRTPYKKLPPRAKAPEKSTIIQYESPF